jgi:hypothetical protein
MPLTVDMSVTWMKGSLGESTRSHVCWRVPTPSDPSVDVSERGVPFRVVRPYASCGMLKRAAICCKIFSCDLVGRRVKERVEK